MTLEKRSALSALLGAEIVRFQEASNAFDDLAAAILSLDRRDLPCMTVLLFGGAATVRRLAVMLGSPQSVVRDTVATLEMAGYARRRPSPDGLQVELTAHAREWIKRIWEPLERLGGEVMARFSTDELASIARFVQSGRELQEQHVGSARHGDPFLRTA